MQDVIRPNSNIRRQGDIPATSYFSAIGVGSTLAILLTSSFSGYDEALPLQSISEGQGIQIHAHTAEHPDTWTSSMIQTDLHVDFANSLAAATAYLASGSEETDVEALDVLYKNAWDLYEVS